jgi:hypothetical protein
MITKGCTSAYTTWIKMNEESGDNAFSYKNIGKRFVRLAKNAILEEIKLEGVENLHGRKDYRLTMKGLEYLLPHIMMHPKEVQNMVKYLDEFGVDKKGFGQSLLRTLLVIAETINEYQRVTNIPYDRHELAKLVNQFYDIIVESGSTLSNEIFRRDVKEIFGILERDKNKKKKPT